MLTEFEVNNFRKFSNIKIHNLSQMNLFFGVNNVGKTSMLEALFAYACGANVRPFFNYIIPHRIQENNTLMINGPYKVAELILNVFHDIAEADTMRCSFSGKIDSKDIKVQHQFVPGRIFSGLIPNEMGNFEATEPVSKPSNIKVEIQGRSISIPKVSLGRWKVSTTNDPEFAVEMDYPDFQNVNPPAKPLIMAKMNDILAHQNEIENKQIYSLLLRSRLLEQVIQEMNHSFSGLDLENIENIPYPDGTEASLSCRFKDKRMVPMYMLGDGVRRWFNVIGNMVAYKKSIHCIEEVDVNFHHKAQENFAVQLYRYAKKFQNQVFATSHSGEFLYSFLQGIQDEAGEGPLEDDIRVITLRNVKDVVKARTLNGKEALAAMDDGLELRV